MAERAETNEEGAEGRLAEWLVAYDSALLSGAEPSGGTEPLPDDSAEFAADVACLELLHRVFRTERASGSSSTASGTPQSGAAGGESLAIPRQIGRFEVLRELGRGGYGIVLLAVDPHLDRQVAIKIPRPEVLLSTSLRERFLREAEIAGRLDHPNLVPVYEVDEAGPLWYIATAHILGGSLGEWVAADPKRQTPRTAAAIVSLLADAVQHAHSASILHRDIKPGNVLMQPLSEPAEEESLGAHAVLGYVPRLSDFGLAKLLEDDGTATASGALLGTPSYMAPEQAAGRNEAVGTATDVYGLGAILYELLTGEPPFRGGTKLETLRRVLQDDVVRPRRIRRNTPEDLEAICLKCLEKDPRRRYLTARELALDLRRYLAGEPIEARFTTAAERVVKWCRRKPGQAAFAGLAIAATLALLAGLGWSNVRISGLLEVAKKSEERTLQLLYAADMQLAQQAMQIGGFAEARRLLEKHIPPAGSKDRREFAWHFLWNVLHRERAVLSGHVGDVYCLAFSPDGKRLASVGRDGYTRIWEFPSGKLLKQLADHQAEINTVAFTSDGKLLATGGDDDNILVRSADDYRILQTLAHPGVIEGDFVSGLAFSPDGSRIYSTCGGYLHLWETATGKHLASVHAHEKFVKYLTLSPDGNKLLTLRAEAKLWNTDRLELIAELPPAQDGGYNCGCFLGDGSQLALGESRGSITIRDAGSFEQVARLRSSQQLDVLALNTSPDGKSLVAGSAGRAIDVFAIGTWNEVAHLDYHGDRVWDVRYSRDGQLVASAGADGAIVIWQVPPAGRWRHASGRLTFEDEDLEVKASAYSPDGTLLARAMANKNISIRDRKSGSVREIPLSRKLRGMFRSVCFLHDGRLVTCQENSAIRVWDAATGRLINTVSVAGQLHLLAVSPREDRIAVGVIQDTGHDYVVLLDWPNGREIQRFPLKDQLTALCFTPSGDELLIAEPGRLLSRDVRTFGVRLDIGRAGETFSDIKFLPDGQRMILAEHRQGAAIRDLQSGRVLFRLIGHPGVVTAIAVHPNGRNVVTLCDRELMRVWDLDTQQSLLSFDDVRGPMRGGLCMDPLGEELALSQNRPGHELSIWDGRPFGGSTLRTTLGTTKPEETSAAAVEP